MRYSCFDPHAGTYRVFEDSAQLPVNGDLPVPQLPPDVNGIGVPALDAARPLPRGARPIGSSTSAVGIIVDCARRDTLSGFGEDPGDSDTVRVVVGVGALALGVVLFYWMTSGHAR